MNHCIVFVALVVSVISIINNAVGYWYGIVGVG